MYGINEVIGEWNEILIHEKCISNPELHALTDAFGTRERIEIMKQLTNITEDTKILESIHNKYEHKLEDYRNELHNEAYTQFNMQLDIISDMNPEDKYRLAFIESIKYAQYNETELHRKKECHCHC